jgi:heme oxygenase
VTRIDTPRGASQRPPIGLGSSGTRSTLAQRLRVETDDAHRAAERAFDLDLRLNSLAGYGDALQALDAFAVTSAPTLRMLDLTLPAALRDGPARRRSRLRGDLVRLGRVPTSLDRGRAAVEIDLDHALGAWYVDEGAALGGLLIAAEVRRRLPQASAATRFFAGEGRGTAARWRACRRFSAAGSRSTASGSWMAPA